MRRTPLIFVLAGALCHLGGLLLGLTMAVTHDYALRPVHAHLNLIGWVSLCLYGLVWRAWPDLAGRRARRAHLALAAPAGVAFPFALWLELAHGQSAPIAAASILWLSAAVWFAVLVGLRLRRRPQEGGWCDDTI